MKRIYKYRLEITDEQVIETHRYCVLLTAQIQAGKVCMWVMIDEDEPLHKMTIYIFGTGNPIPKEFMVGESYLGTVQQSGLVWHIFAKGLITSKTY